MIQFPESIQIGGHTYKVLYPYVFTERSDLCGQCDSAAKEIRICDKDGAGQARAITDIIETFFHEVLHAIDNVYLQDRLRKFADKELESVIDGLANGFTQIFINGHLPTIREDTE